MNRDTTYEILNFIGGLLAALTVVAFSAAWTIICLGLFWRLLKFAWEAF